MEVNKITWKENNGKWTAWLGQTQLLNWVHEVSSDQWYYCKSEDIAKGWLQVDNDGRWYYFVTEQTIINNKVYYKGQLFDGGWMKYKNKWVYCIPKSDSSKGLYRGQALCNGKYTINGKEYDFDKDCYWIEDSSLVSDALVNFVKSYEGYRSKAYYDGTGCTDAQLTIGYGTTKAVVPSAFPNGVNSTCTESQACVWLKQELNKVATQIKAKGINLSQCQFDALCSFAYNCGTGALFGSTLWKNICNGVRDSRLKDNFTAWSKAGGKTLQGLYNRRLEEYNMFMYGDYKRDL